MTYTIDFRRKVLEVKERDGMSFEKVASRFWVSKSSVSRWKKRLELCRKRNKSAAKIDMGLLEQDIELYPDSYQYERAERFGCSQRGIGEALKRLKISRKKKLLRIQRRMKKHAVFSLIKSVHTRRRDLY